MVHSSPPISTVSRSAERRARLIDARRPVYRRCLVRFTQRAASIAVSLAVTLCLFPRLLDASRTDVLPPAAETAAPPVEKAEKLPVSVQESILVSTPESIPESTPESIPDREEGTADRKDGPESLPEPAAEPVKSATKPAVSAAEPAEPESPFFRPYATANTFQLTDDLEESAVKSQFAVLIDAQTGEILAERSSDTAMNPASMTKVLTLLVAVEALTREDGSWDLDSAAVMTKQISEYCWVNDCSMAWFSYGEIVPVRDTLYGMILPSGADAALMLANRAAGSQEALVERMNAKAQELGISGTAYFENCVGLYGERHVCTVRDMAVIMKAAMDHPVCRTVLGKEVWTTTPTEQHPNGILLLNRFLRRAKSADTVLTVTGAKTGYVRQAGNCAVSMARRADGREYICVTGKGTSSTQVVRDHAALYRLFCGGA